MLLRQNGAYFGQPPTAARDWLIVIASLIVASDDNLARLQVVAADWTQTDKVLLLLLLLPPQFSPHKADEKDDGDEDGDVDGVRCTSGSYRRAVSEETAN